ncbi:phosphopantetheine-binding protein [Variovorax sp. J2P1-59]|uniref:phosphopantetheine-binding protein n=1 Tax=Variovorax flavidus TaxID=3053501 RepID=UPI002578C63E|nr:phosphopantetheine-binding protein [Variovorax sp. J2P1-59]MDM0074476.1 phosphopantetheine-binding protein [Variovorax sp. J2P1-59]
MDQCTLQPELITVLTTLVLEAVERPAPEGGLSPDEPLFGPDARLDLDSLDALQLSMTIQQHYGVRMPDSKETRRAFTSIAHLAEYLGAHRA